MLQWTYVGDLHATPTPLPPDSQVNEGDWQFGAGG